MDLLLAHVKQVTNDRVFPSNKFEVTLRKVIKWSFITIVAKEVVIFVLMRVRF